MTKVCTKCKEEKSKDLFYKDKHTKDGHKSFCKGCENVRKPKAKEGFHFCSKCGDEQPKSMFFTGKTSKSGTHGCCKKCKGMPRYYWDASEYPGFKICSKCNLDKPESYFTKDATKGPGVRSYCRDCAKSYQACWMDRNPDWFRNYYQSNRDKVKAWRDSYRRRFPDKVRLISKLYREQNSEYISQQNKAYAKRNRHLITIKNRLRNKTDVMFNLKARVRARVRSALSQLGLKKNSTTSKMLDCTFIELQAHIAAQFSAGMTWENRNLWEIDHIVPLASAKTESDLIRLSHHTNLQPMWTEDNRRKGAKMPEEWELQNA